MTPLICTLILFLSIASTINDFKRTKSPGKSSNSFLLKYNFFKSDKRAISLGIFLNLFEPI